MRCSICGNDLAKTYIRKTDGRDVELTLCPACYELHYPAEGGDFFASFVGHTRGRSRACPSCGMTLEEFRVTGLLGCADCYQAFREDLLPTIRSIQGKTCHAGKAPSGEAEEKYDLVIELVKRQEELRLRVKEAEHVGDEAAANRWRAELDEVNRRLYGGEVKGGT